jgi:hypothetical protein
MGRMGKSGELFFTASNFKVQYYASYPCSEVRAMDRIISAVILLAVNIALALTLSRTWF